MYQSPMYIKQSMWWFMLSLVAPLAGHAAGDATAVGGTSAHRPIDTGYHYGKHRAAPPSPPPGGIPPGSTLFSLELEDGYWDVVIQDNATFSEVQCSGEGTSVMFVCTSTWRMCRPQTCCHVPVEEVQYVYSFVYSVAVLWLLVLLSACAH